MEYGLIYIIGAAGLGLLMTWGVGSNDLSNVLSTTMGSKAVKLKHVIIIAIIFEFAGAFLASGSVTNTIRHGIIDLDVLNDSPQIMIYGMLSVLAAGTCWITLASYLGLPVSITHTIIGSIVGFGVVVLGVHAVYWPKVILIGASWITAPILAGTAAYLFFQSMQLMIFLRSRPFYYAKRIAPLYLFLIGFVLSEITVLKGLEHFNIFISRADSIFISLMLGILCFLFISNHCENTINIIS